MHNPTVDRVTHFFSCDWGTSSFRLRLVRMADGRVLAEYADATGIRALQARHPAGDAAARGAAFAGFLRERLVEMVVAHPGVMAQGLTVVVSGMASSTLGWHELPYAAVPVGLDGVGIPRKSFPLELPGGAPATVHLVSGLRTATDILRGEEVEILGLFAEAGYPEIAADGLVVLPGTHSKHVRLQGRQITGFHTYITGELFDVLSTHSLLRASVKVAGPAPDITLADAMAREAFLQGVHAAWENGIARSLFQTRTRTVLQSVPPGVNRWYLSGLLVGAEVADLSSRESAVPILLAATAATSPAYRIAFEAADLASRVTVVPPAEMALASVRGQLKLLGAGLPVGQWPGASS